MTRHQNGRERDRPPVGAVYPRVSSAKQEDGYSLDSQQAAMIAFAAERGIQVPPEHIYREVHTGEELWERPALNRLREAVKQRAINVAIFYAVDRFARRQIYFEIVLEECRRAGVDVLFVTQSFDETPEGTLLRSIAS